MIKTLSRICLVWFIGWAVVSAGAVFAGELDEANRFYGQGVHAYLAGLDGEAESLLSQAISQKADDPRMYYFRALSLMRQGRSDEARHDMSTGAEIESQHPAQFAVGVALQRVQGGERLVLEEYRRQARTQADQTRDQIEAQQHQQIQKVDSTVLRQPVVVPLEGFLQPGVPRALTPDELSRRRPINPPTPAAPRSTEAESLPVASEEKQPFGEEASEPPAEVPAQPPAPEPTAPAETQPESDEDPFLEMSQ